MIVQEAQDARRIADNYCTGGDIPGHHRTGAYHGVFADGHARQHRCIGADGGAAF
ncbi:hypothetical protein D3C78_1990240 [compost metagenome]